MLALAAASTMVFVGDPGSGDAGDIAGYSPGTDVTQHASIDADQAAIESALKKSPPDYAAAKAIYKDAGVSLKPSRTLAGFSTAAATKMAEEKSHLEGKTYYGDDDWGHKWVMGALDATPTAFTSGYGDADFKTVADDDTRVQAIKKGTVYLNAWPYAIHEMEAAIAKCKTDSTDKNNAAVHAWDEGVAFYAGALAGSDGSAQGKLMYALSNKRCKDFNTCGASGGEATGTSQANIKIIDRFTKGKADLEAGKCDAMRAHTQFITDQGYVAIIQGALKYADYASKPDKASLKAKAEAATFAAGILPKLSACSGGDAATVYNNLRIGVTSTSLSAVKTAFENNYPCLGIVCSDVGAYGDSSPCVGAGGRGAPVGAIVGGVVGGVVGVGVLGFIASKTIFAGAKGAAAGANAGAAAANKNPV